MGEERQGVELGDILESKLASFYSDAIAAARARNYDVTYALDDITSSEVSKCELVVAGSRHEDMKGLVPQAWPFSFFGPVHVMRVASPMDAVKANPAIELNSIEDVKDVIENLKESAGLNDPMLRHRVEQLQRIATIRLSVDMKCLETFCVRDSATGAVIQGDASPTTTNHEVTLEAVYRLQEHELGDWTVVDIDNWLGGNKFWEDCIVKMHVEETEAADCSEDPNKEQEQEQEQEQQQQQQEKKK
jgi:hypothetical protein